MLKDEHMHLIILQSCNIKEGDAERRIEFCRWLLRQHNSFYARILFIDELLSIITLLYFKNEAFKFDEN